MPRLPAPLRDLADRASAYTATIPVPVMAALWMVGSGVFFTGLAGTIRHLGQEMHPFEVALFRHLFGQIGRASCRVRVCPYGEIKVVGVSLTQQITPPLTQSV